MISSPCLRPSAKNSLSARSPGMPKTCDTPILRRYTTRKSPSAMCLFTPLSPSSNYVIVTKRARRRTSSTAPCARVLCWRVKLMFSKILRMQFLGPMQLSKLVMYLPQFVRVFYRLYTDERVSMLAKTVPWMGLALMLTPPALELDMIPIVGELDWLVIGYLSLKVFIWLCPPDVVREHVVQIGRGE